MSVLCVFLCVWCVCLGVFVWVRVCGVCVTCVCVFGGRVVVSVCGWVCVGCGCVCGVCACVVCVSLRLCFLKFV